MKPILKVLITAGILIPMASGSGARADFILEVDGQSGTSFTAQIESSVGDSVERMEIEGTVPARYVFDARGVRVRMAVDPDSSGRIHAILLRDGEEVSQASGKGSGSTLFLQSGDGLPANGEWSDWTGYGGTWSGAGSGGSGGGWGGSGN